jgi:hypothetical protein
MSNILTWIIKPRQTGWDYFNRSFHNAKAEGMPKENEELCFEGLNPPTLFREFAAECMELAQTIPSPEKRALYLKMASVWHQMAQRWEKKS